MTDGAPNKKILQRMQDMLKCNLPHKVTIETKDGTVVFEGAASETAVEFDPPFGRQDYGGVKGPAEYTVTIKLVGCSDPTIDPPE